MLKQTPKVHVIGAGVIGLTTALVLQIKGYDVTVLAKHFPGDKSAGYESGVQWKSMAPNSDARLQRYESETFKLLWELAKCQAAEAGIMVLPAFDYYEQPDADQLNPWWNSLVPGFQGIPKDELPPYAAVGYRFTTVSIYPERYLKWLLAQFLSLGGKRKRIELTDILDAVDQDETVDVIVNCAGRHATKLNGVFDKGVLPVREQNVLVRAGHIRKTLSVKTPDSYTYIIPRSDGIVVLGTTQEWQPSTTGDHDLPKDIMERACKYCPELTNGKGIGKLDTAGHALGICSSNRLGGPRVENEFKTSRSGKPVLLAHNYGHDGFGYQSSWGSAKHVARLVEEGYAALQKKSAGIQSLLSHL